MARPVAFRGQPAWTDKDDHDLLGLYVRGKPLTEYAAELEWSEPAIGRAMRRLDLEVLPRGRPRGRRDAERCDRQRDKAG